MSEQFTISRRPIWAFLGDITVTIECDPLAPYGVKLGLAVRAEFGARADLRGADLRGADLRGADLRGADLRGADLRGAVLRGADLTGADLTRAVLTGADLTRAVLTGAVLTRAVLRGADLRGADLTDAVLRGEKITRVIARVQREIDPYQFTAFELEAGGVKILAGCRWFTVAEFCSHVAAEYPDTPKARETLDILSFIEARAKALGIESEPKAEEVAA